MFNLNKNNSYLMALPRRNFFFMLNTRNVLQI